MKSEAWLVVTGRQGHVAYPRLAANPVPAMLAALAQAALDPSVMTGSAYSNAAGSVIGAATNYGVDAWRQRADLNSEYNRPMVNNLIASGNEQI